MHKPTKIAEINSLLNYFIHSVEPILINDLVGIYLTGSLSYGDFSLTRSDIDLLVVVKKPLSPQQIEQITILHNQINQKHPAWDKRIECSYLPCELLESKTPPTTPRPYYGEGTFYPAAPYGNEWMINNYLLQQHAITLFGPDFKTLLSASISINSVKEACLTDLKTEWAPKLNNEEYLNNPHYQSYLVLNLCRILYTVLQNKTGSKKTSAAWVKKKYPHWQELINVAESWQHGQSMAYHEQAKLFLQFVILVTSPQ